MTNTTAAAAPASKRLNRVNNNVNTITIVRNGSDMPVPQSQNAPLWNGHTVQKEGWEESIYIFYAVGIVLQAAVLLGAPETSIESWARPEAKARLYLASKGQTEFEFGTHYADLLDKESMELWSKFAAKAVNPGDDDDDDDDEDDEEEEEDEVRDERVVNFIWAVFEHLLSSVINTVFCDPVFAFYISPNHIRVAIILPHDDIPHL
jgi:hypothetical protein